MSPYDNGGRIHKETFLVRHGLHEMSTTDTIPKVSNLVLFVLCLISASARFYVRCRIQKQFSIDDTILLFGLACLICAIGLLFTFIDEMYLVGASEAGIPGLEFPPDFLDQSYDFHKMVTVALILTWCSIVSVKFSYLFLFKKLINRMRALVIYWWLVVAFNGVISAYGAAVYIAACPKFYTLDSCESAPVSKKYSLVLPNFRSSAMCLGARATGLNSLLNKSNGSRHNW